MGHVRELVERVLSVCEGVCVCEREREREEGMIKCVCERVRE